MRPPQKWAARNPEEAARRSIQQTDERDLLPIAQVEFAAIGATRK
jgi:hypothetical protein